MIEKGLLGNTIRMTRIKLGITQEELAEMVDITTTHLKHIESEHRKPSIDVLFKLAVKLNLSLDNLLFDIHKKDQHLQSTQIALCDCSEKELKIIQDVISSLKHNR